jgi:hypothetical protein
MSSDSQEPVEPEAAVEQFRFKKGKKEKPIIRKIRDEHGTPTLSLPKKMLEIGLKLNQEVVVEKVGNNPFAWEIRIRPNPHALVQPVPQPNAV